MAMKYGADATNFTSPTTTADTAISIEAASGEVAEVVYLSMQGSGVAAAADTPHRAAGAFCDFTTQGTPGSTPTPEVFGGTGTSLMTCDIEYTAEPTNINTVQPVSFGFNQRGGMTWAVPRGEGLWVIGGATEDGFVWTVVAQAAGAVDAQMHWWEPRA